MTTHPRHRRKPKLRRTGRHTAPSAVEKVAQSAGKAAPAVVVVGALAASQAPGVAHHTPAAAELVVHTRADAVGMLHHRPAHHRPAKGAAGRSYTVHPGDTLSGIAGRYYGQANDWRWLYHVNRAAISDPNLIYPGEVLRVPHDPPASFSVATMPAGPAPTGRHHARANRHRPRHAATLGVDIEPATAGGALQGTLGCAGLEQLWETAGGAAESAVTAASVAMAESGGDQFAESPTDDIGYWQINAPTWGALASTDPMTNAKAAVQISADGSNWSPWTTYTSGVYAGRC